MRSFILTFSLFFIALLGACQPEITCREAGCAFGLVCDEASGECATRVQDCRVDDICRNSEVCDESSGVCRSQTLVCSDGNPCPTNLVCNARSGFCEPAFRCSISGCPAAEVCDSSTERCLPKPCAADVECPSGFVCDETCRLGCRPGTDACGIGESCLVETGETYGSCEPRCTVDQDCPFGQFCDLAAESVACVPEGPCQGDDECRSDEICRANRCVQPPCSSDEECLDTQVCEISTGTCLPDQCEDDVYSSADPPNHARENAARLPPAAECIASPTPRCTYQNLSMCSGRSDWFVLRVGSSEGLRIRVDQVDDATDIDMYIWDENGRLMAQNTLLTLSSTVRIDSPRAQDIYVEIRPTDFQPSRYSLTILREFCQNDLFEENDTLSTATTLNTQPGVNAEVRGTSCGLDEDWFRFLDLPEGARLRIERSDSETSLLMNLYGPDGPLNAILREQTVDYLRIPAPGTYYLQVLSGLGLSSDYRFNYSVEAEWSCPGAGEFSTFETARLETPGTHFEGFCPQGQGWEVDWWALQTTSGNLQVAVSPGEDAPELQVVLLQSQDGATPTPVRSAAFTGNSWELTAPTTPGVDYLLRVSSSSALGGLKTPPSYEVRYESGP